MQGIADLKTLALQSVLAWLNSAKINGANLSVQFDAYGAAQGLAVNNVSPDYSVVFYCPLPAGSTPVKETATMHYVSLAGSAVCVP